MEDFSRGRPDKKPSVPGEGGAAIRTPSKGDSSSPGSAPPSDSPTLVDIPGHGASVPSSDSPTMVDTPGSSSSDSPTMIDIPSDLGPDSPTMVGTSPVPGKPPAWKPRVQNNPLMLEPGSLLGQRYEILQILGEGGMGAVYKARDVELNRMVALKVIRPDLAGNQSIIDRFKQELLLATQVTHKNVIRIYDLSEADGMKFITMEYVEGEDLRGLMMKKQGKLSPEEAVEIMQQTCRALEAAHSAGIIHRDLKPQNIMRDKSGRILVMDFGLARTLEGDGMTQTGALVGTMDYMSPEQALGKDLDQRSDLFALGLIFYELLTGKMPYKADSVVASLLKRTQERAAPVSSHDGTIPKQLSDVVSRCMEPDVKMRYQSSAEILADLDAWQGGRAAATLHFPSGVRPWGRSYPWHWFGAAAAVVILSIVGFLFRGVLFGPSTKAPTGPVVSLAILPFRNASGDPSLDWLGPSIAEMLTTDVGQSASLRTVSPDRLHQILTDLHMAANVQLDPANLRQISESSNADNLVSGQYIKFGDQIRIDASLQDLRNNRRIPLKVEAAGEKDIQGAVDRLADAVRHNLAVSPDVIKELKASSFQPTSDSVPALRDYNHGVQLLREGKNLDAVKSLQNAVKEDSQFALAYSRLADADSALGYDDDAEQASRKAVELSQQLPLAEKYLIEAGHARIVKDNKKAIQAYENLSKTLPDNGDVQYALASLYLDQGDYDKARAVLLKVLQADPKNIRALWKMGAVEITSGNSQAALDPLNKGLSVSNLVDNQEQKALILLALGIAYKDLNKPDEALRNYLQSLDINKKIGQKRAMAADLSEMAQMQVQMGKSDSAIASYNNALQIRQEIGAKKEVGDTLIDLGNVYLDRGQHEQAFKVYKESLQIQRDAGDETNQALCLNNIGNLYLSRADYEDALTYLQQALQLRQKLNVPQDIAETLHNLGVAYANLGQNEAAMSDLMKALDLYRNAGDNRGAASLSHSLAFLFERQGRYGAAVSAMQDALKPLREASYRSVEMAQSLADFAAMLAEAGRGSEAGKPLDEAQALARELKNDPLQTGILNTRGDVLFYGGDVNGAKALYEQASRAASHGSQPDQILISKINVAKAALAAGQSASISSELGRLAQQADALGQRPLSVECSVYLAQAMINSKDYSRARQQLEQSLGKSEKLGFRMQSARIHYLLGTALRLSGNSLEAPGQYREALRLFDEMKKEPGADHLLDRSDLRTLYAEATRWAEAAKS